ncbi:hypothetical protein [Streptomyces antimycoticus]|nr:hypothetical protein [Streptomyces antimycoticus]
MTGREQPAGHALVVVSVALPGTYSVLVATPGGTDTTVPPNLLVL